MSLLSPDKPGGRGLQLQQSAVKKYAVENKLNVLQPEKLKNPDFLAELKSLNADLQIVVAFRMLPELVWNMPPMGTVNLHGSLLPQYRGAAPIHWAVMNGEKETGVTTFKLKHEIDTGDILLQESFLINENDTTGIVHDKMKEIGARLLVKTVEGLANKTLTESPQSESPINTYQSPLKHAPKLTTETCEIDWNHSIEDIYNKIRGLNPYPIAFTYLDNKKLKIFITEKEPASPTSKLGEYETDGKTFLKFAGTNGYIYLKEIQLEGKKKMKIEEFLRGYRFA